MQKITIATDASVSDTHGIATWACYIVTPVGVLQYCRQVDSNRTKSIGLAELYAICNALSILDQQIKNLGDYEVVLYSDCDSVLSVATKKNGTIRKRALEKSYIIDEYVTPITSKCGKFELKYVRAHTLKTPTRSPETQYNMNRWCDVNSRRLLRKLVAGIKAEQGKIEA